MPAPLILTFVSTLAFAIQLLIFAYLYSSHRVRFFQYLLLAWGAYTLSKGLRLVDGLVLDVHHPSFATDAATVAAVGFTLAASFAHRWDYRLRGRAARASGSTRACARPSAWQPPASSRPAWRTRSATRSRPSSTPPRCSPTRRGSRPTSARRRSQPSAPRRGGSTASSPTSCTSRAPSSRGARPATSAKWSST